MYFGVEFTKLSHEWQHLAIVICSAHKTNVLFELKISFEAHVTSSSLISKATLFFYVCGGKFTYSTADVAENCRFFI